MSVEALWKGHEPVDKFREWYEPKGDDQPSSSRMEELSDEIKARGFKPVGIVSVATERKTRTLDIPELPVSKNEWQRWHWAKRGRVKAEWHEWVWGLVNEAPAMRVRLKRVTVHLVVSWNKPGPLPDTINVDMAHECIADGLVEAGVLISDRTGYERGSLSLTRHKGHGQPGTLAVLDWTADDELG